jgi:triosephosphate isomerase (TIM)
MTRSYVISGNWKMNKTIHEASDYLKALAPLVEACKAKVYLAVPFTALYTLSQEVESSKIVIGVQNMHDAGHGAFTGELSGDMLKDAGAKFVILGHSERRALFQESSEWVNRKLKKALSDDLQPTLCVGESLEQRENGKTKKVLKEQIFSSLEGISPSDISEMLIAYEPVWAIGTGKTATAEMAQTTHQFIRELIAENWGPEIAEKVRLQYGGSVKPENAAELMGQADIDGLLVGGASLEVTSFGQIVNFDRSVVES